MGNARSRDIIASKTDGWISRHQVKIAANLSMTVHRRAGEKALGSIVFIPPLHRVDLVHDEKRRQADMPVPSYPTFSPPNSAQMQTNAQCERGRRASHCLRLEVALRAAFGCWTLYRLLSPNVGQNDLTVCGLARQLPAPLPWARMPGLSQHDCTRKS